MKKKLWIVVVAAVCLALVGALAACNKTVTIELSKTEVTVTVGQTTTLVATTSDQSDVTWSSGDESIAKISARGVITGVKAGETTVTATSGSATATCKVVVKDQVKFVFKDSSGTVLEDGAKVDRDGTLQLSATASDGSTVTTWASSDTSVAEVSNSGLVTGIFDGEATISVKTSGGATGSIKIIVEDNFKGEKYTITDNKEAGKWWYYTASDNGKVINVNRAEFRGDVITFDFSGTNYYYTDVQLGLANDSKVSEGWHRVNFKINSDFEGAVTVLGTRVNLKNGDNDVSVAFNQEKGADSFHMYFANTKASSFIGAGKVVIKGLTYEAFTPITLQTPSFELSSDDKVTVTDTKNTEGVAEYEVGLFEQGGTTPVFSQKFDVTGGTLDTSTMEQKGTFYVKLRAVGNVGFNDSAWTTEEITREVDNGDIEYDMPNSGQDAALTSGKWERWAGDGGSVKEAKYLNGVVTVEGHTSGWATYGVQLFRHYDQFANGTKLAISMKVNSSVAGNVEVCGTVVKLVAGDNDITVYKIQAENNATIVFLLGAAPQSENPIADKDITLSISNVRVESFAEATKLQVPTFAVNDKALSITDEVNEKGVDGYELGFFTSNDAETAAYTLMFAGDGAINDSKIKDGEYVLKIRAVSNTIRYETSAWSDTMVNYTVAHGEITAETFEPDFTKDILSETNEGSTPKDQLSLWYVMDTAWNCGSVVTLTSSKDVENKSLTFTYNGGSNDWCTQLIYKNSNLVATQSYKLTLKINITKATAINVNGQSKELKVGDNDIEVTINGSGTSLIIKFNQQSEDVTVTVSDIVWTEILA